MNDKIINTDFCFAFLGHPELDSRTANFADSLEARGFSVAIIGFDWFGEGVLRRRENYFLFPVKRRPAPLFYYDFFRLLKKTLSRINAKVYVAEDVHTLPAVFAAARKRNAKIYYDSRELYAFIGGLARKPFAQKIVAKIERRYIGKTDLIIVTGEMDRDFLAEHYSLPKKKFAVIRNLPKLREIKGEIDLRKKFDIAKNKTILIYQGILSGGRGLRKTVSALKNIPDAVFVIAGDGPLRADLEKLAEKEKMRARVFFTGMVPNEKLLEYTASADIGIALIENISVSYYYALPNKLFEYLAAGLPVIVSSLPQMKKIVERYDVGFAIDPENETELANAIKKLTADKNLYARFKANAQSAAAELNWEKEFAKHEEKFRVVR